MIFETAKAEWQAEAPAPQKRIASAIAAYFDAR